MQEYFVKIKIDQKLMLKKNYKKIKMIFLYYMETLIEEEIGRVAFGTVYVKKDDPSLCIKVSNKSGTSCRQWSNEYNKIMNLEKLINKTHIYNKIKMVRIIIPQKFVETRSYCYMIITRIFRQDGKDYNPILQAHIGNKSGRIIHKERG